MYKNNNFVYKVQCNRVILNSKHWEMKYIETKNSSQMFSIQNSIKNELDSIFLIGSLSNTQDPNYSAG